MKVEFSAFPKALSGNVAVLVAADKQLLATAQAMDTASGGAIGRALSDKVKLVDSAQNCATAVANLLDRQSLRAPNEQSGKLRVALTDAADNFLNVARDALQLEIGEVEVGKGRLKTATDHVDDGGFELPILSWVTGAWCIGIVDEKVSWHSLSKGNCPPND